MVGDQELTGLRQRYYGLFVRFFWKEPDPDFLISLRNGIDERIKGSENFSPQLAQGWRRISLYLENNDPGEVDYEFAQLFLGPHKPSIFPYESYYLAGAVYQAPLREVRGFMREVGLEKKEEEQQEPEDTLGFEMEIMNWLINKQSCSEDIQEEERWIGLQAKFLTKHLLVWAPDCARDLQSIPHANFYKGVGMLLKGFLEIELQNFRDLDPDMDVSIEVARKRYAKRRAWSGPVFDAEPSPDS